MRAMIPLTALLLLWPALPVRSEEPLKPPVEIILAPGEASAIPVKKGVAYANGGVIDVAQPNPTTVVVTMTGLTAADADSFCTSLANYHFDLAQGFEVVFNSKDVKTAKLTLEGRVCGLLRTEFVHQNTCLLRNKCFGTAETLPAVAAVCRESDEVATLTLPARAAGFREDLSVYNHEGPLSGAVTPGKYVLHETWGFGVTHAAFLSRGASAEFSPQPNYVPESNSILGFQPFNGSATRDFGFQVTLKIIPEF